MDEESSDNKKIKTDEKITEIIESEPVISSKEISSKKNVCTLINIIHPKMNTNILYALF